MTAKTEILLGARDAGWIAEPEHRGEGWVADVLAVGDRHQVAFEVQASHQVESEYLRRQQRYADAGIRCAWFARHESSVPAATEHLPVFLIEDSEDTSLISRIGHHRLSLRESVRRLLTRQVKYREWISSGSLSEIATHVYEADCYRCSEPFLVWNVGGETVTGACGGVSVGGGHTRAIWSSERPEDDPAVKRAVEVAVSAISDAPMAMIGPRSTRMSGTDYCAFFCPHCYAVFGDFYLDDFLLGAAYEEPLAVAVIQGSVRGFRHPHWCLDAGDGFCHEPAGRMIK